MRGTAILLLGLSVAFFIAESDSAPNRFYAADGNESKCNKQFEDSFWEQTTDHVPWLEEGIKTGDALKKVSALAETRGSDGDIQQLKRGASEALKDLKRASSKVETAVKKASEQLQGGKRNDVDKLKAALENAAEDAKAYLIEADSKMKTALETSANKSTRGNSIAMAIASSGNQDRLYQGRLQRHKENDYDHDDDGEKRRHIKCRRPTKTSCRSKKDKPKEEEDEEEEGDDYDYNEDEERDHMHLRKTFLLRNQNPEDTIDETATATWYYGPKLVDDDYRALFRALPETTPAKAKSAPSKTLNGVFLKAFRAAQTDIKDAIETSMNSLFDFMNEKIQNETSSFIDALENDPDAAISIDGYPPSNTRANGKSKPQKKEPMNVAGQGDDILPGLGLFPLRMADKFMNPSMIEKLVTSLINDEKS